MASNQKDQHVKAQISVANTVYLMTFENYDGIFIKLNLSQIIHISSKFQGYFPTGSSLKLKVST